MIAPQYSSRVIVSRDEIIYRPDIDGLRAIAVLTVVFYHAFPDFVPGGFIGVDIFFVISGYLISSIIIRDFLLGKFSFANFYMRRVRRIFPALLLVLSVSFVAGTLLLEPNDKMQLEYHIVASIGFVSNIVLWTQIGYFDSAADMKPLLHLWSLGVEEQFYAIWPALLWMTFKFRVSIKMIGAVIFIVSFIINIVLSCHNFLDAFYLPQARLWELAIGALMAFSISSFKVPQWRAARHFSYIGLVLIIVGLLVISAGQPYPGWRALLPTIGATLIIGFGRESWFNSQILASPVMVFIGLISYPLYLWHWPVLVFARIFAHHDLSIAARFTLIVTAFILAFLTHKLVETPIRFGSSHRAIWNVALPVAAIFLAGSAGAAVIMSRSTITSGKQRLVLTDHQRRLAAALERASATKNTFQSLYGDRPCFKYRVDQTIDMFIENGCLTPRNAAKSSVLLIGDSHSASLSLGLKPLVESNNMNFLQVSTGWCEPTSNDAKDQVCVDINQEVRRRIVTLRPKVVILDSSWIFASRPPYFLGDKEYNSYLVEFISELLSDGAGHVVVVGQVPAWTEAMPDYLEKTFVLNGRPIPDRTYDGVSTDALKIDDVMSRLKYPQKTTYVSIRQIICDTRGCLTHVGPDFATDVTFWDYGHLTPPAAHYVVGKLFDPHFWASLKTPTSGDNR